MQTNQEFLLALHYLSDYAIRNLLTVAFSRPPSETYKTYKTYKNLYFKIGTPKTYIKLN